MATQESKVEMEAPPVDPAPARVPEPAESSKDVPEDKPNDSKAFVAVEKDPEAVEEKPAEESIDRDVVLARVATEKRLSHVRAWEESEKSKAENKAQKKVSDITSSENSKKVAIEIELKKFEEKLEKKKAEYEEKMQNKVAMIHKQAVEKRAIIEAHQGEELLKAEETAAKYRATGTAPKKLHLGIF